MYLVIANYEDTQEFKTSESLDEAKKDFQQYCEEPESTIVTLCKIKPGDRFGFGYNGFYGDSEVIEEWEGILN